MQLASNIREANRSHSYESMTSVDAFELQIYGTSTIHMGAAACYDSLFTAAVYNLVACSPHEVMMVRHYKVVLR